MIHTFTKCSSILRIMHCDIKFNSVKSHCISFGGCQPSLSTFTVMLNDLAVQWVDRLKYLGCYCNQSCTIDYNAGVQKFYGNFNNILSVLSRHRNEICAVNLVNSYCFVIFIVQVRDTEPQFI